MTAPTSHTAPSRPGAAEDRIAFGPGLNLRSHGAAVVMGVGLLLLAVAVASAETPEVVGFNQHVRPILSNNCFYCHGPDEKHREADLRLDTHDGAVADLGGYAAVVPGKPDESALLERVTSHDPDTVMPPPASKKARLSDDEIAILRKWIEQGAKYEGHWAFLPLAVTAPPDVRRNDLVQNPIDRFILARLEREGIQPSPEAQRAVLIRRVYLDLIGLLPTPEELAAFVSDPDPAAYERLVDRLLASPHYGERWGRHWLDQARYADSNGYSIDSERQMWPYRDWVIQALNEDMPFDQFTIEQLAGDLLPNPSKEQLVATAFHRNTLINEEGGTDGEQFRNEAVVDRVNTTGAVWLGLTVGCAQCHTHKFDPITHREYYSLFAFFNQGEDVNDKGATVNVSRGEMFGATVAPPPSPTQAVTPEELARRQAEWERARLTATEQSTSSRPAASWAPVEYVEYDTKSGAGFQRLDDNSLLSDGRGAFNDTYRVVFRSPLERIGAVRLRVLTHESLPKHGPGRASNGNFVLTNVKLLLADQDQPIAGASADHQQPSYSAADAVDDDPKSGWAINVPSGSKAKMNANHELVATLVKSVDVAEQPLELQLHHDLNENYLIGRFAIEVSESAPAGIAEQSQEFADALKTPGEKRTAQQKKLVQDEFERNDPIAKKAKAEAVKKKSPPGTGVMVMKDAAARRETFVLLRGDFLNPDKSKGPLDPGVIAAVSPAYEAKESASRLELAKWLVDARNPLTPRVTVNRIWMRYFGRGLVETDEDFGTQGSPPTHPELLDWLSAEFIRSGWSQKSIHRLIATSSVYRQSSEARPELAERDPRNLLLAGQERMRVEAEIVRDAALSASGLLTANVGGPGVRPPQPDGVYAFTQNAKKWDAEQGADRYRRTMYTVFFRSAPHPMFTTFDTPDMQTVCTRRIRSNSPLQALTVANDVTFVELAQGIAGRAAREMAGRDAGTTIQRLFELCLCRRPTEAELGVLMGYHQRLLHRYEADSKQATGLLKAGLMSPEVSPAQAAALVGVARALVNTDNFITRE